MADAARAGDTALAEKLQVCPRAVSVDTGRLALTGRSAIRRADIEREPAQAGMATARELLQAVET
jgi:hypothetical protein